jgi:hypothetical protein
MTAIDILKLPVCLLYYSDGNNFTQRWTLIFGDIASFALKNRD